MNQTTFRAPSKRSEGVGVQADKLKYVCDIQAPVCPVCHLVLRTDELQEHMELEMEKLIQLHLSGAPSQTEVLSAGFPQSGFAGQVKREGGSSVSSPGPTDEAVHTHRYQTFLRVRSNRQTRLSARIGKLKRRKTDEQQQDSMCVVDDRSVLGEEYEWSEQRRHMVSIITGFRGLVGSMPREPDSDVDLDVDGDELSYGRAQYTEADVIPNISEETGRSFKCSGDVVGQNSPEHKWSTADAPSTSSEAPSWAGGTLSASTSCKSCHLEMPADESLNILEALKSRIRDLEKQLTRGDRIKCLICMDSYVVPLASIQCWHVHCEECWLRTLGAKKLCPQCNTITSPGDLRRVYL